MPDSVTTVLMNAWGYPERRESDSGADGVVEHVDHWLYDSSGRLVEKRSDSDNDGVVDSSEYYDYGIEGRLKKHISVRRDLALSTTTEYEYDDSGRLVGSLYRNYDGYPDVASRFVYDSSGRLVLQEADWRADGKTDATTEYEWNGSQVVREVEDRDNDGLKEGVIQYSYDSSLRLVFVEISIAGGDVSDSEQYEYDEYGRLSRQSLFLGEVKHDSWQFSYDNLGRLAEEWYWSVGYPPEVSRYEFSGTCPEVDLLDPEPCTHPIYCRLYSFLPNMGFAQ